MTDHIMSDIYLSTLDYVWEQHPLILNVQIIESERDNLQNVQF